MGLLGWVHRRVVVVPLLAQLEMFHHDLMVQWVHLEHEVHLLNHPIQRVHHWLLLNVYGNTSQRLGCGSIKS